MNQQPWKLSHPLCSWCIWQKKHVAVYHHDRVSFLNHWQRGRRDKADKQTLSRKTSLIWRCSCHVVARPHQAIRKWHIAQSGHFSIAGGLFCFTSAMPTQSSLVPKEKVSTLVIWGLIRYSHRLRIYLSLECALREDPAASEASVNGDPNKECGFWCSWRTATFFLPLALVKVNETNLLGVSLAVCFKLYCLWLLHSLFLMMTMCQLCVLMTKR